MTPEAKAALDTLRDYVEEGISLELPDLRDDFAYVLEAVDVLARELERLEQENAQVLRNIKAEAVQTIQVKEYGSDQFHRAEAERARADRLAETLLQQQRERFSSGLDIGQWRERCEAAEAEVARLKAHTDRLAERERAAVQRGLIYLKWRDYHKARAARLALLLRAAWNYYPKDTPMSDSMGDALAEHGSPESGEDYDYKDDSAEGRWGKHGSPEEARP